MTDSVRITNLDQGKAKTADALAALLWDSESNGRPDQNVAKYLELVRMCTRALSGSQNRHENDTPFEWYVGE